MEKRVREGYFEEMQQALETNERLQAEKDRKAKNTAMLQKRMGEIAKESDIARAEVARQLEVAKKKEKDAEIAFEKSKKTVEALKKEEEQQEPESPEEFKFPTTPL